MAAVETKYILEISSRLPKFAKKKNLLYNFRCPYCGDSKKHRNKARGYLFGYKNTYTFKCHNCGVSKSFTKFLKDFDTVLYNQFVMEMYQDGRTGKGRYVETPKFDFKPPEFKKNIFKDLVRISDLNISHQARSYLENRRIPQDKFSDFYYCEKFKEWTNSIQQTFDSTSHEEPRIIIPFYDRQGNCFGFQGRSLSLKAKIKYITIIIEKGLPKIYGLDKIDETKPIYIVEGPFDSTFVDNSVAMAGSDVDIRTFGWSNYIWVYDNEPRNRQIVDRISRTIDRGERVVIWQQSVTQKDINDMILAGLDVQKILKDNTYSGLEAKLQFTNWKKI